MDRGLEKTFVQGRHGDANTQKKMLNKSNQTEVQPHNY